MGTQELIARVLANSVWEYIMEVYKTDIDIEDITNLIYNELRNM